MAKRRVVLGFSIVALAIVAVVALNLVTTQFLPGLFLDFTKPKIYTLSSGTEEIVSNLHEPINLRFYYSKKLAEKLPNLQIFASRVQDLLQQYQRLNKSKLKIEVIEPEPFSRTEEEIINYGLTGVNVDNSGSELYMGLVASNSINSRLAIPFLNPAREANLEYDISQLLYKLSTPQPREVGVLSSLDIMGEKPWAIWQQISQLAQLVKLEPEAKEIPKRIKTLVVVQPSSLPSQSLQAIDSFVMRGGRVLMFMDPHSDLVESKVIDNDYLRLLTAWGVNYSPDHIVADRNLARTLLVQGGSDNKQQGSVRYPIWMELKKDKLSSTDVISSSLDNLNLATVGAIAKAESSTTNFEALAWSSNDATLVKLNDLPEFWKNLQQYNDSTEAGSTYVFAARLSGPIQSIYSEQMVTDSNIVLFADLDILHEHFWLAMRENNIGQKFAVHTAHNVHFILNAIDNLGGSDALIAIRNHTRPQPGFTRIIELQSAASRKYRDAEAKLVDKIARAQAELSKTQSVDSEFVQRRESNKLRFELLSTKRQLRDLRRQLNADIEALQFRVQALTLGSIPVLVLAVGLVAWFLRRLQCSKSKP